MKYIITEKKGYVIHIILNRADKMNAFNVTMLQELSEAYTSLEEDKDLRCGLLYTKGDHFTTGLDLESVAKFISKGGSLFDKKLVDPLQLEGIKRTKPVVMVVYGYCLTIAIELILANDICIASKGCTFGQIEIKRGIFPFGGATIRFPQRCGWGNAMRYLLTGDLFDEDEALRIGLIQEIVNGDAIKRGIEIANTIADQSPLGVSATLVNAHKALIDGDKFAIADLQPIIIKLMESEDAKEGVQSFIERRKARFHGN